MDIIFEKEGLFSLLIPYSISFVTGATYSNLMHFLFSKQKCKEFLYKK